MRKLMLLAALATAAAALAVPTAASAIWTVDHVHLPGGANAELHAEGNFAFTSSFGGVNCNTVTTTIQLKGGQTTGTIGQFNPVIANCTASGMLTGCKVTEVHRTGLSWVIHSNAVDIQATKVHLDYTLTGFLCPANVTLMGDMTVTPESPQQPEKTTMQGLVLEGQLATNIGPNATVAGTLGLTPASSNKYGFT